MITLPRFLDRDGDQSGSHKMNINAAIGPVAVRLSPPPGFVYMLYRLMMSLKDGPKIELAGYGSAMAPLTNGITIQKVNPSGVLIDYLDGETIKETWHWAKWCDRLDFHNFGTGPLVEAVNGPWTFDGKPVILNGDQGEELVVTAHDDLAYLMEHGIVAHGVLATRSQFAQNNQRLWAGTF